MITRILVPLDGSFMAEEALHSVRSILRRRDAEVLLLHATGFFPLAEGDPSGVEEHLRQEGERYLRGVERGLAQEGAKVRSLVRLGSAAEAILDTARTEHASLVAMTTHGRTGLPRWVFGSVAEKVLRTCPVPVLLDRSFAGKRPEERALIRTILVPIDLSELSLQVIPPVAELASLFEAKVVILNVCGEGSSCAFPVPQITRAYEELRSAGVPAEPAMAQGDPAAGILETALERSADLIAMTTHGRSGVSRWMLGSVTEKVLRCARVPMLVVRGGGVGREEKLTEETHRVGCK
jgi:nucleotide-binding universal stress UspA family protein